MHSQLCDTPPVVACSVGSSGVFALSNVLVLVVVYIVGFIYIINYLGFI